MVTPEEYLYQPQRQGDVYFECLSQGKINSDEFEAISAKRRLKVKQDNIILEGEISGNFHRLEGSGQVLVQEDQDLNGDGLFGFLVLEEPSKIVHDSRTDDIHEDMHHETLVLGKGIWRVIRQREADHFAMD